MCVCVCVCVRIVIYIFFIKVIDEALKDYTQFTWHYINSTSTRPKTLMSVPSIAQQDGGKEIMRVSLSDLVFQIQGILLK